ncbi:hypothetical protein [Halogranum rubrum]|uniref:CHAT domain-containing protein n=1 Tax=Halogranum salarium B-1 TaxID=1210908 RepID=J3JFW0_9EURY|nr:hypothetical protein [Halogranum salarium]EJN59566.1 hypothetical protein HSB1_17240 [Halogranum salarium B-1]
MTLRFEQTGERTFRIVDDIEHAQYEVSTSDSTSIREASKDRFLFPVDGAVSVEATTMNFPTLPVVVVRGPDGRSIAQSSNREDLSLPHGQYDIEVLITPMKLYLAVDAPITISYSSLEAHLSFGSATDVSVGVRSFHEQPAGTVTTTPDVETMMQAVGMLGSSLQASSCERSFPTLRGHPPLIELGEEFSVPAGIDRPETGLTLVLPREHRSVFAAAPLAFYLGANVVPGREARLDGDGWSHSLTAAADVDIETGLARTLRQVFFFDCVTRTEGYYPVDLHERRTVESTLDVDIDFATLYDQPLAEQVRTYLDVPFDDLSSLLPQWTLTTDIDPTPTNVEMLPFVANDLAVVRCSTQSPSETVLSEQDAVTDFFRKTPTSAADAVRGDTATDTISQIARGTESAAAIVEPEPVESIEHAWVGDGYPLGASKETPLVYRRRLDHEAVERTSIDITVVCNDEAMREEDVVADLYGFRDHLQFDIDVHYDLTRDQLARVLRSPTNFLHYIGHVDEQGLQCADGFLDVTALDNDVAVESFLLNACSSYEQGEALIDRGSYGGVVTLTDVGNRTATEFGRTLARLLNRGFTLRSSLSIAQHHLVVGYRYIAMGDGGMSLCQAESGAPTLIELESAPTDGQLSVTVQYFTAPHYGVGSMFIPYAIGNERYQLVTSKRTIRDVSVSALEEFFSLEVVPVRFDGDLYWSDTLSVDQLTDR